VPSLLAASHQDEHELEPLGAQLRRRHADLYAVQELAVLVGLLSSDADSGSDDADLIALHGEASATGPAWPLTHALVAEARASLHAGGSGAAPSGMQSLASGEARLRSGVLILLARMAQLSLWSSGRFDRAMKLLLATPLPVGVMQWLPAAARFAETASTPGYRAEQDCVGMWEQLTHSGGRYAHTTLITIWAAAVARHTNPDSDGVVVEIDPWTGVQRVPLHQLRDTYPSARVLADTVVVMVRALRRGDDPTQVTGRLPADADHYQVAAGLFGWLGALIHDAIAQDQAKIRHRRGPH